MVLRFFLWYLENCQIQFNYVYSFGRILLRICLNRSCYRFGSILKEYCADGRRLSIVWDRNQICTPKLMTVFDDHYLYFSICLYYYTCRSYRFFLCSIIVCHCQFTSNIIKACAKVYLVN